MNDRVLLTLTIVSALGSGLVGGVFFGFSAFIMRALDRIPPEQGAGAMRSINVVVINPWFMTPLFGAGVLAAVAGAAPLLGGQAWGDAASVLRLVGAVLYVGGCLGVTMARNVPRNDALAAADPATAAGAAEWARYVSPWTAWNTVRTVAALAAAGCFTISLVVD